MHGNVSEIALDSYREMNLLGRRFLENFKEGVHINPTFRDSSDTKVSISGGTSRGIKMAILGGSYLYKDIEVTRKYWYEAIVGADQADYVIQPTKKDIQDEYERLDSREFTDLHRLPPLPRPAR